MAFTLSFIKTFFVIAFQVSPIIGTLLLIIISLGQWVGRLEKWSRLDSLYYSFITATTVGYGDFRPSRKRSKLASIAIALTGVLLTGIMVAIALYALEICFERLRDIEEIRSRLEL
jgi:voltage-gated potassium channel